MILINPQFDRIKKLGIFSRYVPISLPISIGILAGYLLSKGKKAKIIDDQINFITERVLEECVKDFTKPYIFGISCFTAGMSRGNELADLIKKIHPDAFVVMGGIHPTVMPCETLQNHNIDIVVRKEGDDTLIALYDLLKKHQDYRHLAGISYRDNDENVINNEDAPPLADLNVLPPFPYDLFESNIDKYNLGFILSSRGCPYNCIFCSQKFISGRSYRFFDPTRVIKEIDSWVSGYNSNNISWLWLSSY